MLELVSVQSPRPSSKSSIQKTSPEPPANIKILENQTITIRDIDITGLDTYIIDDPNEKQKPKKRFTICLSHTPKKIKTNNADLYCFGHLHGCDKLPIVGKIARNHFVDSYHSNVIITSGLGSPRLETPEIVEINLQNKK